MSAHSYILFPPAELASCMSIGIVRDTRGLTLSALERVNYFPASPVVAFTLVLEGALRVSSEICDLATLRTKPVMPEISVTPPQPAPTQSWSEGPIHALTVGFYTDAWVQLGGDVATNRVPRGLEIAAALLGQNTHVQPDWPAFCDALGVIWAQSRTASKTPQWAGSHRIADWVRHLSTRAALSGAGQSVRSVERRLKRLSGQSKQSLRAYAQMENLLRLRVKNPDTPLAAIAADAQFSDQSHMGRAVKRITGFSPGQLNQLIETDEAFWCYRLLGERL